MRRLLAEQKPREAREKRAESRRKRLPASRKTDRPARSPQLNSNEKNAKYWAF